MLDKEKILAFLNVDSEKNVDKFTMKLITWFNVSFAIVIALFCILLGNEEKLDFSLSTILFITFSLITNILFFALIRLTKNVIQEWNYYLIVLLCSVLTLLYGWIRLSKIDLRFEGNPIFTWMHAAVLIAVLVLSAYMILKFVWVLKLLKNHTVEDARAIVKRKTPPTSMPIIAAGCPIALVYILKGPFENMGLGVGFALWSLMCIWLFFCLLIIPRTLIILKYKIYK